MLSIQKQKHAQNVKENHIMMKLLQLIHVDKEEICMSHDIYIVV